MSIEIRVKQVDEKKEITSIYNIEIPKMRGDDVASFNAFCKAFASVNFINFINNYSEFLDDFFDKIEVTELKTGNKHLLKFYYKKLEIFELSEIYNFVLEVRKKELAGFLNKEPESIKNITDYEKIFYKMLFNYGEKIGGYIGLASLNPLEVSKLAFYFGELEEEKRDYIESKKNKN